MGGAGESLDPDFWKGHWIWWTPLAVVTACLGVSPSPRSCLTVHLWTHHLASLRLNFATCRMKQQYEPRWGCFEIL